MVGEESFKKVLKAALKGEAAHWVKFADTGNYDQLRNRFIEKFWSPSIQREVSSYLRTGAHDGTTSRENYFLKWANHARHLDHYSDDEG